MPLGPVENPGTHPLVLWVARAYLDIGSRHSSWTTEQPMTLHFMTSLEPLRNSQRDFSSSVTLKYIMLQSRGLRADTRSVNEVMLRRIAVIKSSVVFNL